MRLFDALLLAAVAIVGALMTLIVLTFTVVVVFWDTHRLLVLTLVTAAYAVTATWRCIKLRSRLQRWQAFSATLERIQKGFAHVSKSRTRTPAIAEGFARAAKRRQPAAAGCRTGSGCARRKTGCTRLAIWRDGIRSGRRRWPRRRVCWPSRRCANPAPFWAGSGAWENWPRRPSRFGNCFAGKNPKNNFLRSGAAGNCRFALAGQLCF